MQQLSRFVTTFAVVFLSIDCAALTDGRITERAAPEPSTPAQKASASQAIETNQEPTRFESTPAEFARLDLNSDGVISTDEWRGPVRGFRQRDLNADGVVTRRELFLDEESRLENGGLVTADILVSARQRWTNTGLMVEAGDTVTFVADGTVHLSADRSDTARPRGSPFGRRQAHAPSAESPAGSLIARIGDATPLFVGDL